MSWWCCGCMYVWYDIGYTPSSIFFQQHWFSSSSTTCGVFIHPSTSCYYYLCLFFLPLCGGGGRWQRLWPLLLSQCDVTVYCSQEIHTPKIPRTLAAAAAVAMNQQAAASSKQQSKRNGSIFLFCFFVSASWCLRIIMAQPTSAMHHDA